MELTVPETSQWPSIGAGSGRQVIYIYGPPELVFRALWQGLEGGPSQRHFDRVGLLRTADGEACAEVEVGPRHRSRELVARMKRVSGIQVLLTSPDGEEILH